MGEIKQVYFFTEYFPYGYGETFIEHEWPVWEQEKVKLNVVPFTLTNEKRSIGSKHKLVDTAGLNHLTDYTLRRVPLRLILAAIQICVTEAFSRKIKWRFTISTLFREAYLAKKLLDRLPAIKDATCYSYWCAHWMLRLSLLKKAGYLKQLICRVHGFDLYSERHQRNVIPYQKSMLKSADEVYAISLHGLNYLKDKFKLNHVKLSRLAVPDYGLGTPINGGEQIHLVSCSALVEVKRVHLIIKALQQVNRPVNWVHFGSGNLFQELQKLANRLPSNIQVEWKGQVTNTEVLTYYQTNPVHLFVNTSSSEGIPVSIMEAMSFGIPVAASAVGGIPEIVNEQNGFLLNRDMVSEELSSILTNYKTEDTKRKAARNMYLKNYSIRNYVDLIRTIS